MSGTYPGDEYSLLYPGYALYCLHRISETEMEYVKEYWGNTEYYKNGVLHRDGDLPAVITVRGDKEYWKNGRRHRDNGPAIIRKDGVCSWYKNGVHIETC